MKLTLVCFNLTVMIAVFVQFFMHEGPFTNGTAMSAISIGLLIGAVVAGIVYFTIGKNSE